MSMVETAPSKIQVRNLNFYYGKFHALKNINLDIAKNQVTAFIGPSGCGKSTLLRTFNKMFELYPEQQHPDQLSGYRTAACESGHGVPETDAVSDVHLRQHRFWRSSV